MRCSVERSSHSRNIHLYADPSARTLDLREISTYLQDKVSQVSVDVREPLITARSQEKIDELALRLAKTKVRDLMGPGPPFEPLMGEVSIERRFVKDPTTRLPGLLYDGFSLLNLASDLLPEDEQTLSHIHIIFTNRLFATLEDGDGRYHARVILCGFPSMISTTGIVESPAKPKEYYALKRRYASLGEAVPYEEIKERLRGRFIDYDDERLTEVMKGYVMQAVFYHFFGEPFCVDKTCRLFNSHWQEEIILSQIGPKTSEFCERHTKMLEGLMA